MFALALLGASPRLSRARELQVSVRARRDCAALHAPAAGNRAAHQRLATLGALRPAALPAGRAREDRADHLSGRLPAREAGSSRGGAAEGLGAAPRHLGHGDARPLRHRRPRQRAPLLRDLPRHALRRDCADRVRRRRSRALHCRLVRRLPGHAARARARPELDSALDDPQDLLPAERPAGVPPGLPELPGGAVALLDRPRRHGRDGTRQRHVPERERRPDHPRPQDRLHLLRARAGAGADRCGGDSPRLHGVHAARLPHRDLRR